MAPAAAAAAPSCKEDGNLVVYNGVGHALYATGTDGHAGAYLLRGNDGALTVRSPIGAILYQPSS